METNCYRCWQWCWLWRWTVGWTVATHANRHTKRSYISHRINWRTNKKKLLFFTWTRIRFQSARAHLHTTAWTPLAHVRCRLHVIRALATRQIRRAHRRADRRGLYTAKMTSFKQKKTPHSPGVGWGVGCGVGSGVGDGVGSGVYAWKNWKKWEIKSFFVTGAGVGSGVGLGAKIKPETREYKQIQWNCYLERWLDKLRLAKPHHRCTE